MYKSAEIEKWVYPATIGGAWGASTLAQYLLKRRLDKQLEESEKITPQEARIILRRMGLPSHLPAISLKEHTRNAFYAEPGTARKMYRRNIYGMRDTLNKKYKDLKRKEILEKLNHGLVGYHPDYLRAGILAHEGGHAKIHNRPWYDPSRVNQQVLRPVGDVASILAPLGTFLGAAGAGGAVYKNTKNPFLSGAAGAGAGLLLSAILKAPTLINEYQASAHARKHLDESMKDEERKKQEKDSLRTAFGTYLTGSLAFPTLYGAALGGIGLPMIMNR